MTRDLGINAITKILHTKNFKELRGILQTPLKRILSLDQSQNKLDKTTQENLQKKLEKIQEIFHKRITKEIGKYQEQLEEFESPKNAVQNSVSNTKSSIAEISTLLEQLNSVELEKIEQSISSIKDKIQQLQEDNSQTLRI